VERLGFVGQRGRGVGVRGDGEEVVKGYRARMV
jgi:hypothetical protein